MIKRRDFLTLAAGVAIMGFFTRTTGALAADGAGTIEKLELTDAQWKARLTPEQYGVLRHEDTERAFTSALYTEHRKGSFHCAGCDLELFTSDMKFDSGTGWPSFFDVIKGRVETKRDFKLWGPRNEYHCARCGGHHGHVFDDGPEPTGLRYCNNGVALKFVPSES